MRFFSDAQGQLTPHSAVPGRSGPKFELVQDIMVVLLTCKNEEDPIKNKGARVLTRLYIDSHPISSPCEPSAQVS